MTSDRLPNPHGDENHATLDIATVALHEMFLSYMRAGFKRSEALELVKVHIGNIDHRGETHDES